MSLKCNPSGLTQKWSGKTGSRTVICPAKPSSYPSLPGFKVQTLTGVNGVLPLTEDPIRLREPELAICPLFVGIVKGGWLGKDSHEFRLDRLIIGHSGALSVLAIGGG